MATLDAIIELLIGDDRREYIDRIKGEDIFSEFRTELSHLRRRLGISQEDLYEKLKYVRVNQGGLLSIYEAVKQAGADNFAHIEPILNRSGGYRIGPMVTIEPGSKSTTRKFIQTIQRSIGDGPIHLTCYGGAIDSLVQQAERELRGANDIVNGVENGTREVREQIKEQVVDRVGAKDPSDDENLPSDVSKIDIGIEGAVDPINGIVGRYQEEDFQRLRQMSEISRQRFYNVIRRFLRGRVHISEVELNLATVSLYYLFSELNGVMTEFNGNNAAFINKWGADPFVAINQLSLKDFPGIGIAKLLQDVGRWYEWGIYQDNPGERERYHPKIGAAIFRKLKLPYPKLVEGHHGNYLNPRNTYPLADRANFVPYEIKGYSGIEPLVSLFFYQNALLFDTIARIYIEELQTENGMRTYDADKREGWDSLNRYLTYKVQNRLMADVQEGLFRDAVVAQNINSTNVSPNGFHVWLHKIKEHEGRDVQFAHDGCEGITRYDGIVRVYAGPDGNRLAKEGIFDQRSSLSVQIARMEADRFF